MIKEEVWNIYMQEEELDKYPEILKLFDSGSEAINLVKQALLDDRALRPVFMQVLPEETTGKMEVCNKQLAKEKIKGDKTLSDYIYENKGIFLCGRPKVANGILTKGGKIIVAVTDRHYDNAQFSVANLRQCYIPLPDKRFLTFKSSGLFHDPVSKPHDKNVVKFTGIGDKLDKDIALENYLLFLAEEIGIGTARKQNHQLFHVTFHEQDVNLGGQICDREEMHTFESYFERHKIKNVDPFFEIIKESHIGLRDVVSAVGVIKFIYKNSRECKDNQFELLESFFRAYYRRLSNTYFRRWESLIDYLENVILFYFDRDDVLGQDGLTKLREWYRLEKAGRKIELNWL